MPSIDDRVVKMEFDNAQFEKKMSETIQSLEKFKTQLDFTNVSKGLQDGFKGFNTDAVTSGIEGISNKFFALKSVAFTVVSEITRAFTNMGAEIARKAINPESITAGFSEYELKMNSIQTIMAGTGASLDVVNAKLQELNDYSDRTIYSFSDMTQNIGKFTNAGVSLDKAVAAIQGVANVAAVSGANASEAARSMYNFGQALGTGYVRLEDWRSIDLANMGTLEFKQQLIDTAAAMGTLIKQGDEWVVATNTNASVTAQNFTNSLQEQWLTADVLTETLGRYADSTTEIGAKATAAATNIKTFTQLLSVLKETAQSGWAQSFELIVGDLEEAKGLFTFVNDAVGGFISNMANSRNELLGGWKELGGRTYLVYGLIEAGRALAAVLKPIGEAFRKVFPPLTAETLVKITKAFYDFTQRLKPSEATISNISRVFTGLFSVLKVFLTIGKGLIGFFVDLLGIFAGGSGGILSFAAAFGDFLTKLSTMLLEGGRISAFFDNLVGVAQKAKAALEPFFNILSDIFRFIGSLGARAFKGLLGAFDDVPNVLGTLLDFLGEIGRALEDAWNQMFDFGSDAGNKGAEAGAKGLEAFTGRITERFTQIKDALVAAFRGIGEALSTVGGAIGDGLAAVVDSVASVMSGGDFNGLIDLLNVGLIGGVLFYIRKFINEGLKIDFTGGLANNLKDVFDQLTSTLKTLQLSIKADAILKIATAVGILAASMVVLALIDSAALARALGAMTAGFANLIATMVLLDKFTGVRGAAGMLGIASAMVVMAGALLILSAAVALFGTMELETLARGIGSIFAMLTGIVLFAKFINKNAAELQTAAGSLIPFGIGLVILSKAVERFSKFSPGELALGLAGLAGTLMILVRTLKGLPPNLTQLGLGLIGVAIGVSILVRAVERLGNIDMWELVKGLGGLAGILFVMSATLGKMPAAGMVAIGLGLIGIGIGLNLIVRALSKIGELSLKELLKGVGGIAAVLAILAVTLNLMQGTIAGSAAVLVAAIALGMLADVVKTFAKIKFGDMLKGLLGIAAVMATLAITATVLTPLTPFLLAFGLALAALGIGALALGAGLLLAAKAIQIFSQVGPEALANITAALREFILLIPEFAAGLAKGLLSFLQVFVDAAPEMLKALIAILSQLIQGLVQLLPGLIEVVSLAVAGIIQVVRDNGPELIQAGIELVLALLQGLAENIGQIVDAVATIIVEFLSALADRLPDIITAGADLLIAFVEGITRELPRVVPAVAQMIVTFLNELAAQMPFIIEAGVGLLVSFLSGITDNLSKIVDAVFALISRIILEVTAKLNDILALGLDVLEEFLLGITSNLDKIWDMAVKVMGQIASDMVKNFFQLVDQAAELIKQFVEGIEDAVDNHAEDMGRYGVRLAWALARGFKDALLGAVKEFLSRAVRSLIESIPGGSLVAGLFGFEAGDDGRGIGPRTLDISPGSLPSRKSFYTTTVTPVLDFAVLQHDLKATKSLIPFNTTGVSQAKQIASYLAVALQEQQAEVTQPSGPTEVVFNQVINSPKQLSSGEIYRQTRSQLALAKLELNIR